MRTALRVIAWGAASSVALACHGDLSSAVEINGRVSIAINRQLLIASPLDSIELQAQQGGSVQVYAKKLTSADTIVPFNIHVKPGTVRFTAQVRSNTGSLLYAGDTTQDIKDAIRVTLSGTAQNPMLGVSPESLG